MKTHSGKYTPKNPSKWVISSSGLGRGEVVYRSGWELRFMIWCDNNTNIIRVASEPFPIKYYSQMDQKVRRYYPDFLIKTADNKHLLIEIKPRKDCLPSKARKQSTIIKENITYQVNQDKWKSAREFCKKNKMEFVIMDEYALGIKVKK